MSENKGIGEVVLTSKYKGYKLFIERGKFDHVDNLLKTGELGMTIHFVNNVARVSREFYDKVIVKLLENRLLNRQMQVSANAPDGWIEDSKKRDLAIQEALALGIPYGNLKTSEIQGKIGYVRNLIDQAGFSDKELRESPLTPYEFVEDLMQKMRADKASGTKSPELLLKELKEECKVYPDFEYHHMTGYKKLKAQLEKHKLDSEKAELVPA